MGQGVPGASRSFAPNTPVTGRVGKPPECAESTYHHAGGAAHKSGSGVLGAFLAQPDAGAFPVFVNKDHPGRFKGGADRGNRLAAWQPLSLFEVNKRGARNSSPFGDFALFHCEKGAGGSALGRVHIKSDLKSELLSDMV